TFPLFCGRSAPASPTAASGTARTSSTAWRRRRRPSSACWRGATSASSSSGWTDLARRTRRDEKGDWFRFDLIQARAGRQANGSGDMATMKAHRVGDAAVIKIPELALDASDPAFFYPGQVDVPAAVEETRKLWPGSVDPLTGLLRQSIHTWLVR